MGKKSFYLGYKAQMVNVGIVNLIPGSGRSPGEDNGHSTPLHSTPLPTPLFLPGESHGQRSLVGYSPWYHKESIMTEWLTLLQECPCT